MTRLGKLLRPRHVAAVGGKWAESVVEQCLRAGFVGQIWPVNTTRDKVCGINCYGSVSELPFPPDCTFIGVNRGATIQVLKELRRIDAGGAICFASGFAESFKEDSRGADLQGELVRAAGSMPVLGPNCYGMINYLDNIPVWPDVHGGIRRSRGVAIVCQSSNIALNISMQSRGLPVGYIITTGNQAVISQAAIANALLDDARITAIGLYIEGFGDIGEYERLANRARARNIPLIALKAGKHGAASELTLSHTCSLAGSSEASSAILRRLDIGQVSTVPELVETLKLLHVTGPLKCRRLGSMSCSGGEACLMADIASVSRVQFPPLTAMQIDKLRAALGPMVHLANPLDYHTYLWGQQDELRRVFGAMMTGDYGLTCLVIDFPRSDRCQFESWEPAILALDNAARESGSNVAIVASLPENLPEELSERLLQMGIVPFHGMQEALTACSVAADIGIGWRTPKAPLILQSRRSENDRRIFTDGEARHALGKAGLQFPPCIEVNSRNELESAAQRLSFPLVLKLTGFQHKTEHNAVALDIRDTEQLIAAAERMEGGNGFVVEEFVSNAVAEILIGVTHECDSVYMLTLGSGGIHAELMEDICHLLLPVSADDVLQAISTLKVWKLLKGYRGQPAGDIDAVVAAALTLSSYAIRNAETLIEVEVNPFLILPDSGYAADTLIQHLVPER